MTKSYSTKRSLFTSVIALMLCFSMLLGTTFAWFTDSVTSANNIIKSGNLDVEMYWADGKADPATTAWTDASSGPIFNNELWEPGYVEVRHIKIENKGSLALKYQLAIAANGEVSDLADVIDVYYADPAAQIADRTQIPTDKKLGTLTDVLANLNATASGNLKAGEAHTVTLALKMQESAGNEYQNLAIGSDFAVKLVATQLTAENDSFDDQYDVNATYPWNGEVGELPGTVDNVVTISSAAELAAFADSVNSGESFAGKTVKLAADINLGNEEWTPIGSTKATPFKGTFDGQGHIISNLYINNVDGVYMGLFGYVANGKITGVNVKNVELTGYSNVGTIAGEVVTGSISDCHVTGSVNIEAEYAYAGGIVGGDYVSASNCSVIADSMGKITVNQKTGAGGICGFNQEGNFVFENCQVKNLEIKAWGNVGGITGFANYNNVINNCLVENVSLTKTRENGHASIGLASGGWGYNANNDVTIKNNTFKNITLNGTYVYKDSANILYGSEYGGSSNCNVVTDNNTTENITNNLTEYVNP